MGDENINQIEDNEIENVEYEKINIDESVEKNKIMNTIENELKLLPDREKYFVLYYLQFMDGLKAAQMVGAKNPRLFAMRMKSNPAVKKIIDLYADSLFMSVKEVQWKLTELANADMKHFIGIDQETGQYKLDLEKAMKEDKTHLIKKVVFYKNGNVSIELHDSLEAMKQIAKIRGMYVKETPIDKNFQNSVKLIAERLKELKSSNKDEVKDAEKTIKRKRKTDKRKQETLENTKREV